MSTKMNDHDKEQSLLQGELTSSGRNLTKKSSVEIPLWTNAWSAQRFSLKLATVVTVGGVLFGMAEPWILGSIKAPIAKQLVNQDFLGAYVFWGSVIFGFILMLYSGCIGYAWRAIWRRSRSPLLLDSFIRGSEKLSRIDLDWVKSIRENIGIAYHIEPELIYPEDTPYLLRRICQVKDPYSFEVLLESAHQIGIELTDDQVKLITKKIHRQARNVEDLIKIIALYFEDIKKNPPLLETLTRFRSKGCQQLLMNESLKKLSGRKRHLLRRSIKSQNFNESRLWSDACYSRNFSQYLVLGLVFLSCLFPLI